MSPEKYNALSVVSRDNKSDVRIGICALCVLCCVVWNVCLPSDISITEVRCWAVQQPAADEKISTSHIKYTELFIGLKMSKLLHYARRLLLPPKRIKATKLSRIFSETIEGKEVASRKRHKSHTHTYKYTNTRFVWTVFVVHTVCFIRRIHSRARCIYIFRRSIASIT